MESDPIESDVARMVYESTRTSPTDVLGLLDLMCELLRARGSAVLCSGLLPPTPTTARHARPRGPAADHRGNPDWTGVHER